MKIQKSQIISAGISEYDAELFKKFAADAGMNINAALQMCIAYTVTHIQPADIQHFKEHHSPKGHDPEAKYLSFAEPVPPTNLFVEEPKRKVHRTEDPTTGRQHRTHRQQF